MGDEIVGDLVIREIRLERGRDGHNGLLREPLWRDGRPEPSHQGARLLRRPMLLPCSGVHNGWWMVPLIMGQFGGVWAGRVIQGSGMSGAP